MQFSICSQSMSINTRLHTQTGSLMCMSVCVCTYVAGLMGQRLLDKYYIYKRRTLEFGREYEIIVLINSGAQQNYPHPKRQSCECLTTTAPK